MRKILSLIGGVAAVAAAVAIAYGPMLATYNLISVGR